MSMSILAVTFSSVVQWKHVGLILICGTPRSTDRNRPELHFLNLHAMKAHGMPRITIKFHFFLMNRDLIKLLIVQLHMDERMVFMMFVRKGIYSRQKVIFGLYCTSGLLPLSRQGNVVLTTRRSHEWLGILAWERGVPTAFLR